MNRRESAILEMLSEHGRLEVAALAQALAVSTVTVRKDLDELERRGVIRREHGCAVFGGADDINNRLAIHYEEKQCIAAEAARLVNRLYRSRMNYDPGVFQRLVETFERENWAAFAGQLLGDVNCLVQI